LLLDLPVKRPIASLCLLICFATPWGAVPSHL
jgi:hypothetical protein